MQLSDRQIKVAIVLLIAFALGIGYVVWTRSASSEPTPLPGQTIQNPMGLDKSKQPMGAETPAGASGKRAAGLPPATP